MTIETLQQEIAHSLAELNGLYQEGRTNTVLEATENLAQELPLLRAWCHYRLKNFTACVDELSRTPETQGSIALQAYVYAYAEGFKDENKLVELMPKVDATNINAMNALTIAARAPETALSSAEIYAKAESFIDGLDPIEATVPAANLLHNLARLALAKEELPRALEFIKLAIEAYGTETNWHHRGAAYFWKSKILEGQGLSNEAWEASKDSLAAWQGQLDKEPDNQEWKTRVEGAQARERELFGKLS